MSNILRLIVGAKRRGKTTLARHFLSSRPAPRRIAALDPTAEDYPELELWSRLEMAQTLAIHKSAGEFEGRIVPQTKDDFIFFCRAVLAVDNIFYIIDEGGLMVEPRAKEEAVYGLATLGGHWKQDGVWLTQMPTTLPRVVRSQSDEIYFFTLDEENDVEWARNYLKDLADELPDLPVGVCFKKTRGVSKIERISVDITSKKLHIIEA